jgi:hypothetical protein
MEPEGSLPRWYEPATDCHSEPFNAIHTFTSYFSEINLILSSYLDQGLLGFLFFPSLPTKTVVTYLIPRLAHSMKWSGYGLNDRGIWVRLLAGMRHCALDHSVQIVSLGPFCPRSIGCSFPETSSQGVKPTTHFGLAHRLRMHGIIPPGLHTIS